MCIEILNLNSKRSHHFILLHYIDLKASCWWISIIGILTCIGGEVIRKQAMITAGTNFNHLIQFQRKQDHVLVTHGVYRYFRHPAYVGWFWWSIGTQIVLCNPICAVAYSVAAWKFFSVRIAEEEITLLNFFGQDYVNYQRNVGTGIPFINGYIIK
ncbi:Protein-S-isoprenylcysteine O-methyltransferase [Nymphon striatum]|nr:Protein-S-isoprenylcysteine O-methyltransferase [Nymphon striatum]